MAPRPARRRRARAVLRRDQRVQRPAASSANPVYQILGVRRGRGAGDGGGRVADPDLPRDRAWTRSPSARPCAGCSTRSTEDEVPDPVPPEVREPRGLGSGCGRCATCTSRARTRTSTAGRRGCGTRRRSSCRPSWRGGARGRSAEASTARPRAPAGCWRRSTPGCRSTSPPGQRAAGAEIGADLARDRPMQRLLQGEVGSGKTVVALRAMLQVIDAGGQAAMLAPTSVLAAQHVRTLRALLGRPGRGRHARRLGDRHAGGAAHRRAGAAAAAQGQPARRGERAGGDRRRHARAAVEPGAVRGPRARGRSTSSTSSASSSAARCRPRRANAPHLLVTTATPIPRTVAMTVFGELEISELREVPGGAQRHHDARRPGRQPAWMDRTWRRVREEVGAAGGRSSCARGSTRTTTTSRTRTTGPTSTSTTSRRRSARPRRRAPTREAAAARGARGRRDAAARPALGGTAVGAAARPDVGRGEGPGDRRLRLRRDAACSCRPRSSRSASTCRRRP